MAPTMYAPLNAREIRLLAFDKNNRADSENRPVYSLTPVSLDSHPRFVALSYEWGKPDERKDIVVNGWVMSVTKNLADALQAAFETQDNVSLWADALCINQQDLDERSSQVQMIGSIYDTAKVVACWLPNRGRHVISRTFEAMRAIHEPLFKVLEGHEGSISPALENIEWLEKCPALGTFQRDIEGGTTFGNAAWDGLLNFLLHTYWTRVWIVQEVALARGITFLTSKDCIRGAVLIPVVWWVSSFVQKVALGEIHVPSFFDPELGHRLRMVGQLLDNNGTIRMMAIRSIYHAQWEESPPSSLRWHMTISAGLGQKATDPRDSIYGLGSISGVGIKPDYRKSVTDVYIEFYVKWLEHSRMLADPAHEKERYNYKWNPGLSYSTELWFLALTGRSDARQDGDPSWLLDLSLFATRGSFRHIGAHPWLEDMGDFGANSRPAEIDRSRLLVDGYTVDTISSNYRYPDSFSTEGLLHFLVDCRARSERLSARSLLDALVRLLWWPYQRCPSQGPPRSLDAMMVSMFLCDKSAQPEWQEDKVLHALSSLGVPLDPDLSREQVVERWSAFLELNFRCVECGELHDTPKTEEQCDGFAALRTIMEAFLRTRTTRVPQHMPHFAHIGGEIFREMDEALGAESDYTFFSTSKGFLGVTRRDVGAGDVICALRGCPPLMVLRKEHDGYANLGSATAFELKEQALRWIAEHAAAGKHMERFTVL